MTEPQTFRGLGVCSGIAFGRVHIVDRRRVTVPRFHIEPNERDGEVERFLGAIDASETQLVTLAERAANSGLAQVEALLGAHTMILKDAALLDATRQRILNDGRNAEWALQVTVRHIKGLFEELEENFFRERRSDVDIVGDRVLRNLVGAETDLLDHLSEDAIVVAFDLSPADTVALAKFAARAFVTESGGRTSHTAVLARALDVPCVLNVHGIMDVAGSGDALVVDGRAGEVVLCPTAAVEGRYRTLSRRRRREEEALLADRDLAAETTDGERITLLGNIEVSQEIQPLIEKGGEGVGLYRTEFLYIEEPNLSGAAVHARAYRRVVDALSGLELTIRTFDEGGDKFLRGQGNGPAESHDAGTNPALGMRAIRLSLRDVDKFREQIEGIFLASQRGPVRLLLPFVTAVDEVRRARELIEDVRIGLEEREAKPVSPIPVGAMIETPAAAAIVDLLLEDVDFLSVGTNDLVQYLLAADRANEAVQYLYRPCHPAVIRSLHRVATLAREANKPVTICGEIAADPFHAPLLIGLGFRSLSMTGRAIPLVKRMVRRLSAADCAAFVEEALGLRAADEIEARLTEALRGWAPDLFGGETSG